MNTPHRSHQALAFAALAVAALSAGWAPVANAQDAARPPAEASQVVPPPKGARTEPNVQDIVTEDDNVRVEEMRVRGETKKITVQSRLGRDGKVRTYEVLPPDNGRDMSQGPAGKRDAAGQRVWNVMSF